MTATDPSIKDTLEHAWRYFALHAAQRLSLFNFYLLAAASITAGIAASLQKDGMFPILGAGLGLLLVLVSFIFWKLDQRTSFLIKHAETAIIELEASFSIKDARLLTREPVRTAAHEQGHVFTRMWTYGTVFRFVFWIMAIIGLLGIALCTWRYSYPHPVIHP